LPADYSGKWREGLQTQTGKLEFECSSLKRFAPDDPERPVISKYIPSWEGPRSTEMLKKYPLQMISPHPRYSFHTMFDAKDGHINDVKDHRVLIDGHYYWIVRINSLDARSRKIQNNQLVEMFNDRGSVVCAAQVTERIPPGVVHSCEGSAQYNPLGEPGNSTDIGGCINLLTPGKGIIKKSHSSAPNSCLIEVRLWDKKISEKSHTQGSAHGEEK
jgi:trimethylamine-N-oxide reductase (cytochrome c)